MAKAEPFKAERPDGRPRTALVSCRLIPEGAKALTDFAASKGMSRAEFMRKALQHYAEVVKREK